MSRIYFHTRERDAEVRGWERSYMGVTARKLGYNALVGALGASVRDYIIDGHELKTMHDDPAAYGVNSWSWRLEMAMSGLFSGERPVFEFNGQQLASWELLLNTAIATGSDTLRLMTRIDAQCEIHARVDGEDRAWFADLIEQGRGNKILRPESGWEDVIELARSIDDGPIVMSYSVCDGFPGASATTWTPSTDDDGEADWDAFYDLSDDEQWARGLDWLTDHGPRLQPSEWETYRFSHGVSGFDLAEDAWTKRLTESASNGRV
ncbi:hypothetical protein [Rhodococcoides fascians]|uniref:hypothetical protein n=1 Tax=Rhodococcoides fascians TaxID=1828 RepID=UPI00055E5CBC|nr:hypothetical protein [Rhodococcus fascians]